MRESGTGAVTGLAFRAVQRSTVLYITTTASISAITFSPKDKESKVIESEVLSYRSECNIGLYQSSAFVADNTRAEVFFKVLNLHFYI